MKRQSVRANLRPRSSCYRAQPPWCRGRRLVRRRSKCFGVGSIHITVEVEGLGFDGVFFRISSIIFPLFPGISHVVLT